MRRTRRLFIAVVTVVASALPAAAGATPNSAPPGHRKCGTNASVRFEWLKGYDDPATPDDLDRVGVLKIGPASARNVLVLNPGTSAGSTYFVPLAEDIVRDTNGAWQVWSVERRENQLEDQSAADLAKQRTISLQQAFDYYLGWLANPAVTNHLQLIPDADVAFAKNWGMNVEIEDLHRVVEAAHAHGHRVVMGGHSLGGSITTAYATWDFNGKPGAKDLAGLVYIDGGSSPAAITPDQARQSLQNLQAGSPWLAFGGIPAPFVGLFGAGGGLAAVLAPNAPAIGQSFPLLPASLVPPVQVTNEALFGYGVDNDTSPPNLDAAQVHAGRLAASGTPRGWDRAGEITPIQRYATMLSGAGILGHDGTAWYHPLRLTIDSGAVAAGNRNPAQAILDVHSIHGSDLGKHLRIYAFGAALGGQRVLDAAQVLAAQSGISPSNLRLVNRASTYSHNDPSAASPDNDFVDNLIPFLDGLARPPSC